MAKVVNLLEKIMDLMTIRLELSDWWTDISVFCESFYDFSIFKCLPRILCGFTWRLKRNLQLVSPLSILGGFTLRLKRNLQLIINISKIWLRHDEYINFKIIVRYHTSINDHIKVSEEMRATLVGLLIDEGVGDRKGENRGLTSLILLGGSYWQQWHGWWSCRYRGALHI